MSWTDNAMRFLEQSWLSTTIGIVGVCYGIASYIWTRKRTNMAYVHLGEHLLGSASDSLPADIVVQYGGISIPRLTKTIVIIWNNGENTVAGDDIVAKDPLRLQIGTDGKILAISVIKTSRDVNDFKIICPASDATNEALFSFDFLEANDGAVIEVLHTSADRKPRIKGTLKGLPKGFFNLGPFIRPKPINKAKRTPISKLVAVAFSPLALAFLGFLLALFGPHPSFLAEDSSIARFFPGFVGGIAGMWTINYWVSRRKYPKSLHSDTLE